jgi:hypothetical protein
VAVGLKHWHLAHGEDALLPVRIHLWRAVAAALLLGEGVAEVCKTQPIRARLLQLFEQEFTFEALAASDEEQARHLVHVTNGRSASRKAAQWGGAHTSARPVKLKYSSLIAAVVATKGAAEAAA